MCKWTFGFSRNLGAPVVSTQGNARPETGLSTPGPSFPYAATTEETNQAAYRAWYRRAKETKRREMNGGESERLDSTGEAGEFVLGEDPVEGSEASYQGTVVGKDDECIEIRTTYQRNSSG